MFITRNIEKYQTMKKNARSQVKKLEPGSRREDHKLQSWRENCNCEYKNNLLFSKQKQLRRITMASFALDVYQGEEVGDWIEFFKINSKKDNLKALLEDIGVDDDELEEVKEVYNTLEWLQIVKEKMTPMGFRKFVDAPQKTLLFQDENFASPAWAKAIKNGKNAEEWAANLSGERKSSNVPLASVMNSGGFIIYTQGQMSPS